MSISTTASIVNSMTWTKTETINSAYPNNKTQDYGVYSYSKSFTTGVGITGIINNAYYIEGTQIATVNYPFNLQSLPFSQLGSTSYMKFSKVNAIFCENLSSGQENVTSLQAPGSGYFTNMFNNTMGSGSLIISPLSSVSITRYADGWAITSGVNNLINLVDISGNGCNFRFSVLGTSV